MSPLRWTTKSTRKLAAELTRQGHRVSADTVAGHAEKAIPYGIYDMAANTGWVTIGTDHDTAAFAVASIRRWWQARGRHDYSGAGRLLITADGGGSNGYRTRGWKTHLADLAAETGLEITVCHLPPGTSKWNKIEHRLFSHITMNWRGRPLTSHEVMIQTIAATTSRTGLTVQAERDSGEYPTGIRISDDEIAALPITRHRFHGDWNYTLHPQPVDAAATGSTPDEALADRPTHLTRYALQDPELTGMTRRQLSDISDALTPEMEIQREQVLRARRGHERLVAPGAGAKAKLTSADRVLATVLHLRKLAPMHLLGQLFNTTAMTISRAARDVRPLLEAHGVHPTASTARFHTPEDIVSFLDTDETKIKSACLFPASP
ncbi:DDE family transposase [Streptomyces sp. CEV 2-1]|nr:DDE family transposase [Streptomyces sp. CEV 2-1]